MIVGVDASNLRAGGGVTHLVNVLEVAEPERHGIRRVRLWASRATLARLPERPWLELVPQRALEGPLPRRVAWQRLMLPRLVRGCDLLFAPGGTTPRGVSPVVTMSRNMLPFEWRELRRYGASPTGARLLLLRYAQSSSFRRAAGVIFLTRYAEQAITREVRISGRRRVIPHGVSARFLRAPRPQRTLETCTPERPFRIVYVSIVDLYKHQWHVARAAGSLRRGGLPIEVTFVGPAFPAALPLLERALAEEDPGGTFLRHVGEVSDESLPRVYLDADAAVFASSCENMPNILLEAMASGLPIACAERGPMPEVLGDAGVYFDPESPAEIAAALQRLVSDPALRAQLAGRAHAAASAYTWSRCAEATFGFLSEVAGWRS